MLYQRGKDDVSDTQGRCINIRHAVLALSDDVPMDQWTGDGVVAPTVLSAVGRRAPRNKTGIGILRPTVGNTVCTTTPFPVRCPIRMLTPTSHQRGINSSFSIVLMSTTSHRVRRAQNEKQGPEKGDLVRLGASSAESSTSTSPRTAALSRFHDPLQGYIAYKKTRPPRTLP